MSGMDGRRALLRNSGVGFGCRKQGQGFSPGFGLGAPSSACVLWAAGVPARVGCAVAALSGGPVGLFAARGRVVKASEFGGGRGSAGGGRGSGLAAEASFGVADDVVSEGFEEVVEGSWSVGYVFLEVADVVVVLEEVLEQLWEVAVVGCGG